MKTFAEYEAAASRTMSPTIWRNDRLVYGALGLAGEAGEVVELVKKIEYHARPLDKEALIKECGDCLWMLVVLAGALGVTLADIAEANARKLAARYPDGYSHEACAAKADEAPRRSFCVVCNGDGLMPNPDNWAGGEIGCVCERPPTREAIRPLSESERRDCPACKCLAMPVHGGACLRCGHEVAKR